MNYDFSFFDQPVNRRGTHCDKWDSLMAREGRELLPMWVADMDFRCPSELVEALKQRAEHPVYGYTEQSEAAVDAMLGFMRRRHHIDLTRDQQTLLPCVVSGLRASVCAFTAPGNSVLVQPPVYGPFFDAVRENDRELIQNPLIADRDGRYRMDYEGLEEAFQAGVKLMLLCSPHNPVCRVWNRKELDRVYELCKRYDVILIADEIHSDFVYEQGAFSSALQLDDREDAKIIVLTSASKTFNLAGLQQSVALTRNPRLKRALIDQLRRTGVVSGNIFALTATEAAYREGDAWLDGLIAYLDAARTLLREEMTARLPEAVMSPQEATYLAWLDLRAYGLTTAELMKRTYDQGVAFTSGQFFDKKLGEGFLRFNFACPHSQTLEAVRRLEKALKGREY